MKKPRKGDLFEVRTANGLAYYQYIHDHPFGPIVRVLTGDYQQRPSDLSKLVTAPNRFVLISPIGPDLRNGRIVLAGNFKVPERDASMPVFRDRVTSFDRSLDDKAAKWVFERGGARTAVPEGNKAQELPIRIIAGAIAIARLIDEGWDGKSLPAIDQIQGDSNHRPAHYFLICRTRAVAETVGAYLHGRDFFDIKIADNRDADTAGVSQWTVAASHSYRGIESIQSAEEVLDEVVRLYDVTYDGNEIPAL